MTSSRNLLLVLLEEESPAALRQAIAKRGHGETTVHVVAAQLSALQWLATDEDEARAEADARALEAEWLLADDAAVEGAGVDPVQAVEDAPARPAACARTPRRRRTQQSDTIRLLHRRQPGPTCLALLTSLIVVLVVWLWSP